jgi:hypothetical protein
MIVHVIQYVIKSLFLAQKNLKFSFSSVNKEVGEVEKRIQKRQSDN